MLNPYELFTLDKYYIDKFIKEKNCKIDTSIYNIRWQKLIDSLLEKDYNKRPNIEEVYDYIIKDEKARELIERINKKMDYDNNKKTWEIVNDNNSKKGLGFLCRISFLEEFQGLLILITNNRVINKDDIIKAKNKSLIFILNNSCNSFKIKIDDSRKIYINQKYDISLIEINQIDNINSSYIFDIDENIYKNVISSQN